MDSRSHNRPVSKQTYITFIDALGLWAAPEFRFKNENRILKMCEFRPVLILVPFFLYDF